jgi:hypothetical protein
MADNFQAFTAIVSAMKMGEKTYVFKENFANELNLEYIDIGHHWDRAMNGERVNFRYEMSFVFSCICKKEHRNYWECDEHEDYDYRVMCKFDEDTLEKRMVAFQECYEKTLARGYCQGCDDFIKIDDGIDHYCLICAMDIACREFNGSNVKSALKE